ncbi:hypothetical protein [Allobaculum sp. Allo2]|uniref:hypothetical protein n=1 Tax=Allobaculum sp. Allo2 TaxID=2853432 RepID=UPI001F602AA3|nr:hypothetical protein [Allobaculum sp. Allo2]UNT92152.1 hypothetical protein KWG61_07840 [Allobaculum sp. Allo2]
MRLTVLSFGSKRGLGRSAGTVSGSFHRGALEHGRFLLLFEKGFLLLFGFLFLVFLTLKINQQPHRGKNVCEKAELNDAGGNGFGTVELFRLDELNKKHEDIGGSDA